MQQAKGRESRHQGMTKVCPICQDEFVVEVKSGKHKGKWGPCKCVQERQALALFEGIIGSSDALPEQTFDAYIPVTPKQREALRDAREAHRGMFFYGPMGTGKSHLMNASVLRAARQRIPSVMISVPKLLYLISTRNDKSKALMEQAISIPYLALDDIGKQYAGRTYSWVDERLFMLIDERYKLFLRGLAHTSFTSQQQLNYRENEAGEAEGLEAIMDPALVDRIRHMSMTIQLDGGSFRKAR